MDFRDRVFLAVAENLSFSKAAEELFISQPAVTKHIKELESKLKSTLFDRKGNRIYLTKAGKVNYEYLKKIKQQYAELEFELGRLNNTFKGSLRIGASSTISQYLIPETLAAFYKRYPKIDLHLLSGNSHEIQQKLLSEEIDIALIEGSSSLKELKYSEFLDDEIVVVTGNNSVYAKKRQIAIADLENIPMVLRERGSGTLEVIRKSLGENNINLEDLNIVIHLGSTEAIKNFLINFEGVALVSEKSISKEIELKQIVKLSVNRLKIDRKFRIALRQGTPSYTAQLFINYLSNYNF
ncbi:LysR family transcriptional regulator [Plebeiibacterium sediminum]|uniref:LysR substrate-binding domain-containing protein n=1 Tax=Plebeiibacterium sediminum TaxID=2992112 RepID=A0AAE3SE63_9BACT|nr:LysR family transcriptional regulator [Plebeiobacterium sediminum]MCW3785672.1 LysR substrate-binding domain-containing protein [Plebeiobacterium sediminum]